MKVVFRADASTDIGTGHVMRCLTLADALKAHGATCLFIGRQHEGHLLRVIEQRGHSAYALPHIDADHSIETDSPYSKWLGTDWQTDAYQTIEAIGADGIDWLIVDHYALDAKWENALKPHYRKLLVIDDLANRPHSCDMLLDQNLGRTDLDYSGLAQSNTQLLIGPKYALLRPEFANLREHSLKRRATSAMKTILVSMGGADKDNLTEQILIALHKSQLLNTYKVNVVMGQAATHLRKIEQLVGTLSKSVRLIVNAGNMSELMVEADLAIGAAGGTAWERCAMGLPTILLLMAENQRDGTTALVSAGAAAFAAHADEIPNLVIKMDLQKLSQAAAALCDGDGCMRVVSEMKAQIA